MGHALRLLVTGEQQLGGTVEIDEFYVAGNPRRNADRPRLGRSRNGQPQTTIQSSTLNGNMHAVRSTQTPLKGLS
jgi:hypothetical protein